YFTQHPKYRYESQFWAASALGGRMLLALAVYAGLFGRQSKDDEERYRQLLEQDELRRTRRRLLRDWMDGFFSRRHRHRGMRARFGDFLRQGRPAPGAGYAAAVPPVAATSGAPLAVDLQQPSRRQPPSQILVQSAASSAVETFVPQATDPVVLPDGLWLR